jgi:hypothetical protein
MLLLLLLLMQIKEEPMGGEEPAAAAADADSSSPGELAGFFAQLQPLQCCLLGCCFGYQGKHCTPCLYQTRCVQQCAEQG